ncbi:MAG: helix-turn-helix transcriptional regulator [Bryobacteraceae bacterium]
MAKGKSKAAYMISSVAEQYEIHPQTLRLYEREGLLKPSRSDGNTRLYTDEDLQRLEVILHLTRELGVNLAGVEIILNMREKMAEMQMQIEEFVTTLNRELIARRRAPEPEEKNCLIPVVTYTRATTVSPTRKNRN